MDDQALNDRLQTFEASVPVQDARILQVRSPSLV